MIHSFREALATAAAVTAAAVLIFGTLLGLSNYNYCASVTPEQRCSVFSSERIPF